MLNYSKNSFNKKSTGKIKMKKSSNLSYRDANSNIQLLVNSIINLVTSKYS